MNRVIEPCSTQLLESLLRSSELGTHSFKGCSGQDDALAPQTNLPTLDYCVEVVTPPRERLNETRTRKEKLTTALITQVSITVLLPCKGFS